MANTITFSSDMSLLYLVDDGRLLPFALNKRNGVLVTVLRGQITAVSAPEINREKEEAAMKGGARAVIPDPGAGAIPDVPPFPQKLNLPVQGNQFTVFYNSDNQTLGIIGVTDIDGALKNEKAPRVIVSLFPLKERILNIRREGNRLDFLLIRY